MPGRDANQQPPGGLQHRSRVAHVEWRILSTTNQDWQWQCRDETFVARACPIFEAQRTLGKIDGHQLLAELDSRASRELVGVGEEATLRRVTPEIDPVRRAPQRPFGTVDDIFDLRVVDPLANPVDAQLVRLARPVL